ncbi:MAG: hypothetical protein JXM69_19255 [Anaerolineae bacterium]|nr:hypothetical protein [Anaerolineae bacterium]
MINQADVGEWLREINQRPDSAPRIIQEVARRLMELEKLNEQLRAENLALSTKYKVQQYKDRIAELEYQLNIIGKHLEGQAVGLDVVHLLVYNRRGQMLKLELRAKDLVSGAIITTFSGEFNLETEAVGLLAVHPQDELLLIFASGRAAGLPVADIPVTDIPPGQGKRLNWEESFTPTLPQGDDLAAITPIAKMSTFAHAIQTSRRGYARKIATKFLQQYVAQNNVGKGTNAAVAVDRPFNLILCQPEDILVLVSRQGYVMSARSDDVPVAADQAIRLAPDDVVVASFTLAGASSLVAVTQEGRAVRYPADWLKPAAKLGGRGQSIWSKAKQETGIRVIGAIAAKDDDWGIGLKANGQLVAVKIADIALGMSGKKEHVLKNIYPFDLVAFTGVRFNHRV